MTWDMFGASSLHLLVQSRSSNQPDQIGQLEFFAEEFHAIAARSPRDRSSIESGSWLIRGQSWHMITSHWWPTIVV